MTVVPPNLPEPAVLQALDAVRAQVGWCPRIADIPHYELQTLLSIAIRAYLAAPSATPAPATPRRKPKGPAQTPSRRQRVIERDGNRCYLCEKPVDEEDISMDHVVPRARGGKNTLDNLRVAHKSCNVRKGHMTLDEYRKKFPKPPGTNPL